VSATSPPIAQTPTDAKRPTPSATPVEIKQEQKSRPFKCDKPNCEYQLTGFEQQQQLDEHKRNAHLEPMPFPDDPLKYSQELLAEQLGLNPDGSLKGSPKSKSAAVKGAASAKGKKDSKTSTPPAGSQAMARSSTQPGIKSSPALSNIKTPQQQKAHAPTSAPKPESKESPSASKVEESTDPWANAAMDPDTLAQLFTVDSFVNADSVLRTGLDSSPSTALTPSSSKSSNSRESDILDSDHVNITLAVGLDTNMGGDKAAIVGGGNDDTLPSTCIVSADDWTFQSADLMQAGFLDGVDMSSITLDVSSLTDAQPSTENKADPTVRPNIPYSDAFSFNESSGQWEFDAMDWNGTFGDAGVSSSNDPDATGIPGWDELMESTSD
jgi:hypothetical protein